MILDTIGIIKEPIIIALCIIELFILSIDFFFPNTVPLWLRYLISVNIVTVLYYGFDKYRAIRYCARIPEYVLHTLSLIGGSPAALIAQHLFRHKTKKSKFQRTYLAILLTQSIAIAAATYLHFK